MKLKTYVDKVLLDAVCQIRDWSSAGFDEVGAAIDALAKRLDALEKTLASAEKSMQYRGVWQRSQSYTRGNCATHKGGLWYCVRETSAEPGTSNDWQLTAKPK